MKTTDYQFLRKMGIDNKPLRDLLFTEGLKGIGAHGYLNELLRHSQNYRMRLSLLAGIATELHTSMKYLLKIIKNYGLFVIDGDEFYSPEITNLMLRMKIKSYQRRENELQKNEPKKRSLSVATELNEVKKNLANTVKELNNCKLASLHACAKINTISQLRLREREKEKRETACGEMQKNQLAARNISQQVAERDETEVFNQADELNQLDKLNQLDELNENDNLNQADKHNQTDKLNPKNDPNRRDDPNLVNALDHTASAVNEAVGRNRRSAGKIDYSGGEVNVIQAAKKIKGNGPLTIGSALQRCGEVKLWSDWADEMERDDAYMERIAMHSQLGQRFITARKRVVELFKNHVETYSTSDGLFTLNDVKYYFASFMKPESLTWKWVDEKLREEEEARRVVDPYRFEKRVNGVRMYPGGGVIPDDATPRPSKYAVWSEVSQRWVGK